MDSQNSFYEISPFSRQPKLLSVQITMCQGLCSAHCRSKHVLEPELDIASFLGARNLASLRQVDVGIGKIEMRSIGEIEHLAAEFDALVLRHPEVLADLDIGIMKTRPM